MAVPEVAPVNRTLRVDLAIAVVLALLVWLISPGYAISGLVAIIVLLVCAVSLLRAGRKRRGRAVRPRRPVQRARR
jgi:hypothetical protein